MKAFTVQNTWSDHDNHGWGNGYVAIPPTSSWHGVNYNQIPISVHGGLTWSSYVFEISNRIELPDTLNGDEWIVGFDTARRTDNRMTEKDVERETCRLLGALEQLDNIPYQKDVITQVRCPNCQSLCGVSHLVDEYNYSKELHNICCDDCGKPFYFSI